MSTMLSNAARQHLIPASKSLWISLKPKELFRVPGWVSEIRVCSGEAWISFAGSDYSLSVGKRFEISNPHDFALISAADEQPLTLELWGDYYQWRSCWKINFLKNWLAKFADRRKRD